MAQEGVTQLNYKFRTQISSNQNTPKFVLFLKEKNQPMINQSRLFSKNQRLYENQ